MAFTSPTKRHIVWAKSTHQKDSTILQTPPQMEEQTYRGCICPMQVIQQQEQWFLASDGLQDLHELLLQIALSQAAVIFRLIRRELTKFLQPFSIRRGKCHYLF